MSSDWRERALELRSQDWTQSQIAKEFGLNPSSVHRFFDGIDNPELHKFEDDEIIERHVPRTPRRINKSDQEVQYLARCLARGEITTAEFLKGIRLDD